MQDFAERFYKSKTWQKTRKAYAKSVGGLCEVCLTRGQIKAGEVVHHKTHITPDNINNPEITLNWDNLILLCTEHHAEMHRKQQRRYKIDECGRVVCV